MINEIVVVNPYRAKNVILSLKDLIDELQLQVWRHRIESNVKKANNKTTEIHSLSQDLAQLKTFLANEKKKAPVSQAVAKKKRRPIALPVWIALALLIIVVACGFMFLLRPADVKRTIRAQMEKNIPAMKEIHDEKDMQNSAVATSEKAHEKSAPVEKEPPSIIQKDSTNPAEPDTSLHAGVIYPKSVNNSLTVTNENPIKNEARIMLINASSMHQQGLAARARKRLIERGFSSQNVLTGNNRSKVSRVYAYYSTEKYIPVLKEILAVLYPGKQKSFFDISSKDRTINEWVKDFFNDENLHILIRMPNEE